MFEGLRTWNPVFGCQHNCYNGGCWAKRRLAHRMGKLFNCEYCFDFMPHLHAERLTKIPHDPRIFVVAHGDLFGQWVPADFIKRVLAACCDAQKTMVPKEIWFFETKNPARYTEFIDHFPQNSVLSTTIETNRIYDEKIRGYTPTPQQRFEAMLQIVANTLFSTHVSIEPILNFDLDTLAGWIRAIHPSKVAVGFDSLNNHLPEPSKEKTETLITELRKFTFVERKGGL